MGTPCETTHFFPLLKRKWTWVDCLCFVHFIYRKILEKRHVCLQEDSLKSRSNTQLPCNLFAHKISHIPGILVEPKFHAALKNIP
jgi:hypothetical protein